MGSFVKKKSDYSDIIGTMPSITDEQQAVSTPLQNYLTEAISSIGDYPTFDEWFESNIPNVFGGELGSQAQSVYSEAMTGQMPDMFGGELGDEAMAAYREALSGEPMDYPNYHTEFMTHIIPEIKESYVGTGAVTGTEYGDRVAREAGVWEERANRVRADLYNQAKARQAAAAGNYQQAYQNMQQAVLQRQLAAASDYQQNYQKMIEVAYQNYIAQHPDASTILQAALNYLNIPMMAAYQKPTGRQKGGEINAITMATIRPEHI